MPEIVIVDINNVTIDGDFAGNLFDLAWNRPQIDGIQSLAMAALQTWIEARDQTHTTAMASAAEAYEASIAAKEATIADLTAQIEALGGTELGQRMACEAKRSKLLEIKANAEAELAAIDGGA